MVANRDRNAQHPLRAAAWRTIEHLARLARRRSADLVLYAGDRHHQHATGHQPRTWPGN